MFPVSGPNKLTCKYCSCHFFAKLRNTMYCSKHCKWRATARNNPKNKTTLTPELYQARLERNRLTAAARRKKDPSKHRARKARRKALLIGASIGSLPAIESWMKSWQSKPFATCYWCGKKESSKHCDSDHIHALALGGRHDLSNLCISCRSCNRSKCALDIKEWNKKILQPILL